jgi:hypothetical protein
LLVERIELKGERTSDLGTELNLQRTELWTNQKQINEYLTLKPLSGNRTATKLLQENPVKIASFKRYIVENVAL